MEEAWRCVGVQGTKSKRWEKTKSEEKNKTKSEEKAKASPLKW
jgi:hypothetical protein